MYWDDGPSGWVWVSMIGSMVLFWAVLILAVVAVLRSGFWQDRPRSVGAGRGVGAEEELTARFARGEIDKQEFLDRLTTLREHTGR